MHGCSPSCDSFGKVIRSSVTTVSSTSRVLLFFLVLLVGAALSVRWIDSSFFTSTSLDLDFKCPANWTSTATCSSSHTTTTSAAPPLPHQTLRQPTACPDYFRWIHEDLRPWNSSGINRETVQRAAEHANLRLVVVGGRAYVEHYHNSFETRDVFTLWGILQLLRRYQGRVPDLDLMFNCGDTPVIGSAAYDGPNASSPPPLFRYCKDDATLDIVFPDWSFWGWPEVNIKPWETLMAEMKKGNKRVKWTDRKPYAYWKGNPWVAITREDLMKCNVSKGHDWNARLYGQDWNSERIREFRNSDLANQCIHRYKIYIDGRAWSVSKKYILACNSPMLVVATRYRDFFSRGLMPRKHYWPIRADDMCRSIKFAVDWGNSHPEEAQAIGKEGSSFIQEQVKMEYVYDYMLHLLSEYAKLLKYKPSVPEKAVELCLESMACLAEGREKAFLIESMVRSPHDVDPCVMPPPFSSVELRDLLARKTNCTKQVDVLEREARKN